MGHARPHWLHTRSEPCVRSWELGNGPAGYCPGRSAAPPASRPPRGRGRSPAALTFLWLRSTEGVTKALLHSSQRYFLWRSCTTCTCTFSVSFLLKVASQWWHLKVLSPWKQEVTREENEAPRGVPPAAPTRLLGWTPTGWLQALTTCPTTKGNGSQRVGFLLCRISVRPAREALFLSYPRPRHLEHVGIELISGGSINLF